MILGIHYKTILFVLFFSLCNLLYSQTKRAEPVLDSTATSGSIDGALTDADGNPLSGVVVRVLHLPDSAVVNGMVTDSAGIYHFDGLGPGHYLVKYAAIGFGNGTLPVVLTLKRLHYQAPTMDLANNDITLGEAVVTGNATPVNVIDDTVAYNAAAYQVPEGSMVEDLIEALPGAEITDDGKITINGKEYTKILIDGKEYFGNDPQATLKNLPADIINRIKTYDRHSERARLTGIDDGEEDNVIDIEIKPNMFKGIIGNLGLSAGNESRYNMRLNANRFRKDQHLAIVSNMNNVNNPVFSEQGSGAGNYSRNARPGLTASKSVGITYAKEKRDKYKISGNASYSHNNREEKSNRMSETIYKNGSHRYANADNASDRRRNEFNMGMKLEWTPDTLTTIQLNPRFSYNKTDNWSTFSSRTTNWNGNPDGDTTGVNTQRSRNASGAEGTSFGTDFRFFRRLSRTGRSLTFHSSFNYNNDESNSFARNILKYNHLPKRNKNYNRFSDGDNYSSNYSLGFSYNEPLFKGTFLQLSYNFSHSHSRGNRYGYQYNRDRQDSLMDDLDIMWDSIPVDTALSSCNANSYTSHTIHINMRHTTKKINLSYGVNLNPRHNETDYIFGRNMHRGAIKQDLMNWSPSVNFKYRFTKRKTFDFNYNGKSSDPSINDLQEVINKTNPQYIRYGNPALKPAFTNNLRMNLNLYGEKSHRSLVTNWSYSNSSNSTSNMVLREAATGVSVSKLMNVDGQWNTGGNINFNMPLDSAQRWGLSTGTQIGYSENTNYNSTPLSAQDLQDAGITTEFQDISLEDLDKLQGYAIKNQTHTIRLRQNAQLRFHTPEFSFRLNGGINYYKVGNSINSTSSRETFTYNAGLNTQVELPWNMELSTGISFISRHGFSNNVQKNSALWNAQITQNLFANNAGLLSFQIFDLLHMRNNIDRAINNLTITDTRSMVLGSYFLVSFQYKLNTMKKHRGNLENKRNGKNNMKKGKSNSNNRNRSNGFRR